jgi:DNA end-binding protein Ku
MPQEDVLVMNTLRYADELKDAGDLGIPAAALHAKATAKEIDMALRLIDDMSEKWKPEKFKDTYREDLLARIEEKVKAGQTEEITQPERGRKEPAGAEVIDLMALLKKSVERKQDREKPRRHKAKRRAA